MMWTTGFVAGSAGLLAAVAAIAQESRGFRDDFTGETLAPEFRILNHDPHRMAMVDGDYLLLLTHRDVKNVIAYTGELPEDYQLTVRFASTPSYEHQGTSIILAGNGDRAVVGVTLLCCAVRPVFHFEKHLGDEVSSIRTGVSLDDFGPYYLKVTKDGVEYHAAFSFDGTNWRPIGTHVAILPYHQASVSVYVAEGEDAPESPIRLDSFEIVDLSGQ